MYKRSIFGYTLLVLQLLSSHNSMAETERNTFSSKSIEAERAIILAEAARKKAASVEGEWRDVRKMISQARVAIWKDNLELAMELARKAQEQAELGYAQAVRQAEVSMPSYLQNKN